jgi:hypothetical protein
VRFEIGEYDRTRELVIDPVLFSTFLGGTGGEDLRSMAADPSGNIYVGGSTNSTNFPIVGGFDGTNVSGDVFITKINAAGTAIVYSTYLGGSASDGPVFGGLGIAVDVGGQVAITSETDSDDFPLVSPFQATRVFFNDAFVTRINAAGNGITSPPIWAAAASIPAAPVPVIRPAPCTSPGTRRGAVSPSAPAPIRKRTAAAV